jgi:predicted NAD/FAD-dependent oxidoreductase
MSGIACARVLHHHDIPFQIIDRGRVVGGRMASRSIRDSQTPFDGHITDIGASYFTVQDPQFAVVVNSWIETGIAREWTDTFHVATPAGISGVRSGTMRYSAARGLRSILEHQVQGLPENSVRPSTEVTSLSVTDGGVLVDGEKFGAAAVCLPEPQAKKFVDASLTTVHKQLDEISWDAVIAVTAVFEAGQLPQFDGVFVNEHPVLTWIANDGHRRGNNDPVVVTHIHPDLAALNLVEPANVIPAAIDALLPLLGLTEHPQWTSAMRWTYAKPTSARTELFSFDEETGLGLAGDSWAGGPKVESAWLSGHALGMQIAQGWAK